MTDPLSQPVRPRRPRRRSVAALVVFYLVAFSATIPCFDTPETARHRRLATIHRIKAAECRRLAAVAQAEGRTQDARRLTWSSTNFAWFAGIYGRSPGSQVTWLTRLCTGGGLAGFRPRS